MARASTATRPIKDSVTHRLIKIAGALIVNGVKAHLQVAPCATLLDALRDHLDLTSTKRATVTAIAAPSRC
jgi:hypothetical protein